MTRYIGYSTASMNALSSGETIDQAREKAASYADDDSFIVVAKVDVDDDVPLRDLDALPQSARIVWRGSSAQQFRNRTV